MPLLCCICFENAQSDKVQARVTICGHICCSDCADIWFQNETACPVCRKLLSIRTELITIFNQEPAASDTNRSSTGDEAVGSTAKDASEDVQIKSILAQVSSRWQMACIERAQLKCKLADSERQRLELAEKLARCQEQNAALLRSLQEEVLPPYRSDQDGGYDTEGAGCEEPDRLDGVITRLDVARRWRQPPGEVEEKLNAASWTLAQTFATHSEPVHGIAVGTTSSGRTLVGTASWDHRAVLYDVEEGAEVTQLLGHSLGLYAIAFSKQKPDLVATVSSDHTCRLWSATSGECLQVLEGHADEVNGLSFQANSSLLATASDDHTAIIWDTEKAEPVVALQGHRNTVYGVCFQPRGSLIATASFDWTAKLWDPRTGEDVQTLEGHQEDVIGVDMDESGRLLVTGSDDTTAMVWDLRMGQPLAVLRQHTGEVKRVAFSPYSRMLATTSGDVTARLFDTSTFECLHVLRSHADHVFDVAWSPSVDFLVTASHDRFWKLWRPSLGGERKSL